MEKQSKVSWVLAGVRPKNENEIDETVSSKLLQEAFLPEKQYSLFICGAEVEKSGTLEEMEEGYFLIKQGLEDYEPGDYGIVSSHEEADLLFIPAEIPDPIDNA